MAKIKGWKKEISSERRIGYGSEKSVIIIQKTINLDWLVYITYAGKKPSVTKYFKTKKQALKFAKNYMKKHPRG